MIRLKTVNPFFEDVWNARKRFEIRKNDRGFQVGDLLTLFEYDPNNPEPIEKPREILIEIIYILSSDEFEGLAPGYVCFGFFEIERRP